GGWAIDKNGNATIAATVQAGAIIITGRILANGSPGAYFSGNPNGLWDALSATGTHTFSNNNLGTTLFRIDQFGHLVASFVGTPVSSALGANVTSVTPTGNDVAGKFEIVMAGALAANTKIATITFAKDRKSVV